MTSRLRFAALAASVLLCHNVVVAQKLPKVPAPSVPVPAPSYAKGPDPTAAGLEQAGPFATQTTDLPARDGFAGARVWYPVAIDAGKYGVIALAPGRLGTGSQLHSWGERISSHGFVVVVINTLTPVDMPEGRAQQLAAALTPLYLVGKCFPGATCSALHQRVDTSRRAFVGHSMGGGGALIGAVTDPSLKAVVAWAPWTNSVPLFSGLRVPTLTVACQSDPAVPLAQHGGAVHDIVPASTPKNLVEVSGSGDHLCVLGTGGHVPTVGKFTIAWLKRFVDNDRRYSPFLCGTPYAQAVTSTEISAYRNNCPY